jgi:hypothetical protein
MVVENTYMIDGKSANTFAYGVGPDSVRQEPPTKDNPAIFVLQKMGMTEPLIHISSRTYRAPRNGTPVEVDLTTGRMSGQGHLRVEAWTEDRIRRMPNSTITGAAVSPCHTAAWLNARASLIFKRLRWLQTIG